jgi:thymidine phosphorylase
MDVKLGNGAFMTDLAMRPHAGASLVDVAAGAGLPCRALITDMNQVLGTTAGNALEVQESIAFLTGRRRSRGCWR